MDQSSVTTTCALCGNNTELQESHIVPKFVFDWLKETSATGYIRTSYAPNLREQDGPTIPLLGKCCEEQFGVWEKQVAENIFKPLYNRPGQRREYSKWMAKFAASVSWRAVTYLKSMDGFAKVNEHSKEAIETALKRWNDFLLDREPHPGPFEQHILPLEGISNTTDPDTPPTMSRYLLRAVDFCLHDAQEEVFIYVKMCHLLLVGFIKMPTAKDWRGTKLHINRGYVGGKVDYYLPLYFGSFLKSRAQALAQTQDSISEKQWGKIAEAYEKDLDRAANSEGFRAMHFDVSLFGEKAFRDKKNSKK